MKRKLIEFLKSKLLEAVELLERAKEEIQNIYGRDNDLTLEIFKFLEDFENENQGL